MQSCSDFSAAVKVISGFALEEGVAGWFSGGKYSDRRATKISGRNSLKPALTRTKSELNVE